MTRPPHILIAEDEETDALLLRLAFQRTGGQPTLAFVPDGIEAVIYLAGETPYNDRVRYPLPDLLLLDLKMPRMTGFEVLQWLADRPDLKNLPAVVLSSSNRVEDIEKARELGAVNYHVKPTRFYELVEILKDLVSAYAVPALSSP